MSWIEKTSLGKGQPDKLIPHSPMALPNNDYSFAELGTNLRSTG